MTGMSTARLVCHAERPFLHVNPHARDDVDQRERVRAAGLRRLCDLRYVRDIRRQLHGNGLCRFLFYLLRDVLHHPRILQSHRVYHPAGRLHDPWGWVPLPRDA